MENIYQLVDGFFHPFLALNKNWLPGTACPSLAIQGGSGTFWCRQQARPSSETSPFSIVIIRNIKTLIRNIKTLIRNIYIVIIRNIVRNLTGKRIINITSSSSLSGKPIFTKNIENYQFSRPGKQAFTMNKEDESFQQWEVSNWPLSISIEH